MTFSEWFVTNSPTYPPNPKVYLQSVCSQFPRTHQQHYFDHLEALLYMAYVAGSNDGFSECWNEMREKD